ncbi:tRNA (cmo5U34)-methyltransferase [Planctomycetes bacterium Pla163]|uniref:tRNA (Cmo5U34)-methyltransferase n=1 Tax=Rohdeia mirabilis TaxID=2528008 RepID=A0A518D533_9BACT|nr:tRNA (cmo5U34)-methyltransferase [Planctomycetes bacterium Pla163]
MLPPIDPLTAEFGDLYDELPLWSAPFLERLLARVPLRPDLRAVDVGCGTGQLAVELAERCGEHARIVAVDPWSAAVTRLRRKLEQRGLTRRVEVQERDAIDLDVPDGSVHVVASNLGLNNFANAGAVLARCGRALAPDGRLLLTTNLRGHFGAFYEAFDGALADLGLGHERRALAAHVDARATLASLTAQLTEADLEVTHTETWSGTWRFADSAALFGHWFVRLAFRGEWEALVPEGARKHVFDAVAARLDCSGALELEVPSALVEARSARC